MSGLSKPSFLRICSTASLVAAGPAKYAAGSPGSARVNRNVTITTPIRLGIANISRLPIMVSMARNSLVVFPISQHDAVCSLPPCGGGLGRGVSREGGARGHPLPHKGGGNEASPAATRLLFCFLLNRQQPLRPQRSLYLAKDAREPLGPLLLPCFIGDQVLADFD